MLAHFHARLKEKAENKNARPVIIVALGDSVTQGVGAVNEYYHDEIYHRQAYAALEKRYPASTMALINAGVDGGRTGTALERLDRDVLVHQPDLVTVAFALNDAVLGQPELFTENLGAIVDRIRERTPADVVLLTPNWMLTRATSRIAACHAEYTELMLRIQVDGVLASYAERVRAVGADKDVPVADVYRAWERLAADGVDTSDMLSNGLNHPNPAGHGIAARELLRVIED